MFSSFLQRSYTMDEEKIKQIANDLKKIKNSEASLILNVISYFATKNIPTKMLLGLIHNESKLTAAIRLLKKYSIVDSDQEEIGLNINDVVQIIVRENQEEPLKERMLKEALSLLSTYSINVSNLDHALTAWSYVNGSRKKLIEQFTYVPSAILKTLANIGKLRDSYIFSRKQYNLFKYSLGADHIETLKMKNNMALMLFCCDNNPEALDIFQDVSKKLEDMKIVDREHILVQENSTPAKANLNKCKEISEKKEEISSIMQPYGLHNSSTTAKILFHNEDGDLNIWKETYKRLRETLGPYHGATLGAQCFQGVRMLQCGKYQKSLDILNEVFCIQKEILGADHFLTLKTRYYIGEVLCHQEKFDESLKLFRETLTRYNNNESLGPNHPDALIVSTSILTILSIQNKVQDCLNICNKIYHKQIEVLGSDHPSTIHTKKQMEIAKEKAKHSSSDKNFCCYALRLYVAAKEGDSGEARLLIQCGVSPNYKDDDGCSSLHWAVYNGHKKIVKLLLENGADPVQVTYKGNTSLHLAISKGYREIVEVLLEHDKINNFINATTISGGTTPLHVATKKGLLEIATSLLKHGATYNIKNKEGKTPVDLSVEGKVTNLLMLVEDLFRGVKEGNVEVINKLRTVKPDEFLAVTNARNNQGNTLFHVAIVSMHKNIVSELAKSLIRINNRDNNGNSSLHWAVYNGNRDIVQLLLENGGDPAQVTDKGKTPLHIAASNNDSEIVEVLLQHDKINDFINAKTTFDGNTPLHVAAKNSFMKILFLLLKHGANISIKNKDGKTPIELWTTK